MVLTSAGIHDHLYDHTSYDVDESSKSNSDIVYASASARSIPRLQSTQHTVRQLMIQTIDGLMLAQIAVVGDPHQHC
jgi:hypothetical protein